MKVLDSVDEEKIRRDVFNLFKVCPGLDAQLSMRKVCVLEEGDVKFNEYCEAQEEAHEIFLEKILFGHTFRVMEENPINSVDMNHGVPKMYTVMWEELVNQGEWEEREKSETQSSENNTEALKPSPVPQLKLD